MDHAVNDGAQLVTELYVFIILIDLAGTFHVFAFILRLFDVLQVANLWSELSVFQQEARERFCQILGSSRHKSHVRSLYEESSNLRICLDFLENISKVVFFKTKLAHFLSTGAHLSEGLAKRIEADEAM